MHPQWLVCKHAGSLTPWPDPTSSICLGADIPSPEVQDKMATLILGAAGAAIGGSIGGAILGVSAATIGGFVGSTIGSVVDSWIVSSLAPTQRIEGARLDTLRITSATEGAVIPQLYGRMRMGGNIIWATDFREETKTTTQGGGKGGGGGKVKTTEYLYYASFAVALCEGPITGIGRIWADGKLLDTAGISWRWYPGDESQTADPFIAAKMGAANTPAYRGTAYVIFEDLPLGNYGNRIPQLSFEVFRPLADPDTAEGLTQAVTMIPASGEFAYATQGIRKGSGGSSEPENLNALSDTADMVVALDRLQAMAPKVESVSLVVAWFGNDLRVGDCTIRPGVEVSAKTTSPQTWSVNGVSRAAAHLVSRDDQDRPVYGGTPADFAVVQAIREMKARGLRVTFYPFILMDVPPGNTLPNPYSDNAAETGQPAFPWRGPDHLFARGGLCRDRGQDRHGSKPGRGLLRQRQPIRLRGLGRDRRLDRRGGRLGSAPHGAALRPSLRGGGRGRRLPDRDRDARADHDPVGRQRVSGGAGLPRSGRRRALDPRRGHGDQLCGRLVGVFRAPAGRRQWRRVLSPRSALGGQPEIDFVGIDNYMPLSDWRDGFEHLDAAKGWPAIYDRAYLQENIAGGEGYDWFYASAADRSAQVRTPITDGDRRQAVGFPLQGSARLVVERALRPSGRRGERHADGVDAAVQADLVHRARLSGHRPGHQPAQRLLRPEVVRELHAAISRAAGATMRSSAPISRRRISGGARPRTTRCLVGLRRPDGACPRMRRLDLGRAALSVLPRADRRLDRRGELAARALADGAAGGGVAGGPRPAPLPARRAARGEDRCHRTLGRGRGLRHHRALESPRASITTLVAPLRLRRRRDRGRDPLRHARPGLRRPPSAPDDLVAASRGRRSGTDPRPGDRTSAGAEMAGRPRRRGLRGRAGRGPSHHGRHDADRLGVLPDGGAARGGRAPLPPRADGGLGGARDGGRSACRRRGSRSIRPMSMSARA
jgi:uncharacterized membrane protein YeaQ/YmgE (transglycosylase-associated protein family)